jgi:hypothetical protein
LAFILHKEIYFKPKKSEEEEEEKKNPNPKEILYKFLKILEKKMKKENLFFCSSAFLKSSEENPFFRIGYF